MKRKKKWQAGRQMLALFMAVAFALSGLNIGAVQAASQDEVVVLDFLNGAIFALKGSINRLTQDLYLITPENLKIKVLK